MSPRADNTCPICRSGQLNESFRATPLDYSLSQTFAIFICSRCGHGKTEDLQLPTDSLYAGGCYDVTEKVWHKFIQPFCSVLEQGKLHYLVNGKPAGKKLLEIGCGKGRFLAAAQERGCLVYGIEPSPRSFAFASARLGGAVASVGLEEIKTVTEFPATYDYIMLWHVLEHLEDPGTVVSRLKGLLAPDGTVVLAVPNNASFQARFGKADWYHLDPPRHRHHFTPESLRLLVSENGFVVETMGFDSFYQNYVGELITMTNKILPGKNVIFNTLRLNQAYFDRFGSWGAWAMFIAGLAISIVLALPLLVLTLFNQLNGQAGTMVLTMKLPESTPAR